MSRPVRIPDKGDVPAAVVVDGAIGGRPKLSRALSVIRPTPRRGLSRDEAAIYVGIGTSKFDELVAAGRMPQPKRIDGRKVWDVRALDLAFDSLPDDNSGSWDDA
jgi:predicted DNA-binding transcriptional regulator AlpA